MEELAREWVSPGLPEKTMQEHLFDRQELVTRSQQCSEEFNGGLAEPQEQIQEVSSVDVASIPTASVVPCGQGVQLVTRSQQCFEEFNGGPAELEEQTQEVSSVDVASVPTAS